MVNKAYTNSLKTKKPYDIVHRLKLKDGTIKFVNEKCQTFFDKNGQPLSSVGTVQDITELKVAEDELLRSEKRFKALFEDLGDAVFFILNAVMNQAEERTRTNTINTLKTVLNASNATIKDIWAKGHFNDVNLWASDPDLVRNTKELLKMPQDPHLLLQSKEMTSIREFFKERLFRHNALGIFIISPDFVSLASMRDQNVGTINLMADQHKDRLEMVFKGHNQIIPPIPSDVPLPDKSGNLVDGYPTMFILAPIKDTDGSIIAALSIRLNPLQDFTFMTQAAQIGFSGETYIVGKDGKLLTESRFLDDLYSIGALTNEKYSMLNIEIRDPGVNLLEGIKPINHRKNCHLPML